MSNELQPYDDGVVSGLPATSVPAISASLALARSDINVQIATARQYPRNVQSVISNITTYATLDEETAQECLYALVRGKKKKGRNQNQAADDRENKPIEGPSIRLAEIAAQCYGNCKIDARVIEVNRAEKYVEAEGTFHDLETNMLSRATVRRRISTSSGYLFSDDMIVVTGNAACAIAKRNAILAGIPKGLYRQAYNQARAMVAGTAEQLSANRDRAISAFARFGVKPEQLFEALGVEGDADIKLDHIATLRAMYATLKNGESTVEEMFGRGEAAGGSFEKVANPLADDDQAPGDGKVRGHTSELAQAEEIVGADGKILKSRDGEVGQVIEDPVAYARERGRKDAENKRSRKAIPPEYREESRKAEADAWLAGFDAFKAESQGSAEVGANG